MNVAAFLGARWLNLLPWPLYVVSILVKDGEHVSGIIHTEWIIRDEDV